MTYAIASQKRPIQMVLHRMFSVSASLLRHLALRTVYLGRGPRLPSSTHLRHDIGLADRAGQQQSRIRRPFI